MQHDRKGILRAESQTVVLLQARSRHFKPLQTPKLGANNSSSNAFKCYFKHIKVHLNEMRLTAAAGRCQTSRRCPVSDGRWRGQGGRQHTGTGRCEPNFQCGAGKEKEKEKKQTKSILRRLVAFAHFLFPFLILVFVFVFSYFSLSYLSLSFFFSPSAHTQILLAHAYLCTSVEWCRCCRGDHALASQRDRCCLPHFLIIYYLIT